METTVDSITIRILEGDICDRDVDAIVNAANNQLWMGGGVAGAIKRRGGVAIEKEAVAKGPIPIGESVATGAGDLKAKHVIHAAVMGADLATDADKIRRAALSALALAGRLGLRSIAFPALGTGVGGFPLDECARIMRQAVIDQASKGTALSTVEFVLFGRDAREAFERVFEGE
ncbi:MAG: macro domain-containing protein [Armatimonadetes bacterium]|nr:macro domain-containing protein [Armatimonadota bacterium]